MGELFQIPTFRMLGIDPSLLFLVLNGEREILKVSNSMADTFSLPEMTTLAHPMWMFKKFGLN